MTSKYGNLLLSSQKMRISRLIVSAVPRQNSIRAEVGLVFGLIKSLNV
jgi:hypothetical protein